MNIVTILNIPWNKNNKAMLAMWIDSIVKNTPSNMVLHILTDEELPINISSYIKDKVKNTDFLVLSPSEITGNHNLDFKLKIICSLDYPFLFLDSDLYINRNLSDLYKYVSVKPVIGIDHQLNIYGHTSNLLFLNSGVLLVDNKDKFLKYDVIMDHCKKLDYKFEVPGRDQAAFYTYFKLINYDYTHADVTAQWNSCAGYGKVSEDEFCNWKIMYDNNNESYEVYINHYWNEFRPWLINCPIFNFYSEYMPNL